jgi:Leucine-rich repeat (LRR) protein
LEEVNIAANKLMMTTDAMFVKWSAVTVLNLYDNNLVRFGSLVNCVSLTELRLSGNAIEAMPTLSSHPSLKIFEMHKNRVSVIPDGYFEATPSLERLSLWGNMLTAVPTSLLSCAGLLGVQLQENKIEALPGGPYPPRLETLFLHDNLLTTLPQGLKRCFALKRVNVAKLNLDEAGTDVAEAMKAICIQAGTSGIFWDKSGVQHKSA